MVHHTHNPSETYKILGFANLGFGMYGLQCRLFQNLQPSITRPSQSHPCMNDALGVAAGVPRLGCEGGQMLHERILMCNVEGMAQQCSSLMLQPCHKLCFFSLHDHRALSPT